MRRLLPVLIIISSPAWATGKLKTPTKGDLAMDCEQRHIQKTVRDKVDNPLLVSDPVGCTINEHYDPTATTDLKDNPFGISDRKMRRLQRKIDKAHRKGKLPGQ